MSTTEEPKDLTRGGRAKEGVGKPTWVEGKTKRIVPIDDNIHQSELVKIVTKDALTANDAAMRKETPLGIDKTQQTISILYHFSKFDLLLNFLKPDQFFRLVYKFLQSQF